MAQMDAKGLRVVGRRVRSPRANGERPTEATAEGLKGRSIWGHRIIRSRCRVRIYGSIAQSVGQNGAFQQQAGESVTRGDRRRRELEARSSSPPLACPLLESLAAFGGNQCSDAGGLNHAVTH